MATEQNQQTASPDTQVPGCLMTIFGATGDLTKRLLLPSIYNLIGMKVLPDSFHLLGVAMEQWDDNKFRDHISSTLKEFWGKDADTKIIDWLTQRASYQQANFDQDGAFDTLKGTIDKLDKQGGATGNRLFYLAVAPSFIASVTAQLSRVGLLTEDKDRWSRLVIEKPFGHDLPSAIKLNRDLQKSLREDQIYRIDHFAGKDAVQDLAVYRFSNSIIEPLWNRSLVDNVQITAAEIVGVESRAGYYDKAGALRDMVPNHLAEMLSLIAMEPPVSFSAEHMRDKQVELMQSIRVLKPEDVAANAVRGQYAAGSVQGKQVPAYLDEPGVAKGSRTETYVAMQVHVDNWRWSGVPFYLRTGKRLQCATTEIVVTFRKPPAMLFPEAQDNDKTPNRMIFNLQPKQEIRLTFGAKRPGLETAVSPGEMTYDFPEGPFGDHGKGYERLLHDAMVGDSILFQRAEFVEAGWSMVQPLLGAWNEPSKQKLATYASGSNGPDEADAMLAATGRHWHTLEGA